MMSKIKQFFILNSFFLILTSTYFTIVRSYVGNNLQLYLSFETSLFDGVGTFAFCAIINNCSYRYNP